jgi:hypothetical protein
VVTTTGAAGAVSQRGIATAATHDNKGTLTNGDWLPTMAAVENMVSASDISSHTVNGAPLSNSTSYFYGIGEGAAASTAKTVSIPSIPSTAGEKPPAGLVIFVKPATTKDASVTSLTLKLNDFDPMPINYRGSTSSVPSLVWTGAAVTVFVSDGTYWRTAGDGGSVYSSLTVADGRAGTATAGRLISAQNLKAIIHGTKLTDAETSAITFTPTNAAINASSDTIMSALGKLQGQVSNRVSTTQSTGYQVLTTGTNGTVTADYISVPVTTSGSGRPTTNNTPTSMAAIWIE